MQRIPVSIVTGFLGAGKTTLLNRLLATGTLDKAALVINELGDIGIDHLLIETADEDLVELSGGCVCCSLRGDLADTLARLLDRNPSPDRIVIETTGVADPGPIAQTVIAHPELSRRSKLSGILALLDAAEGRKLLHIHEEARRQIAMADRIVLTKTDVKEPAAGLNAAVRAINPVALLLDGRDDVSVDWLRSIETSGGLEVAPPSRKESRSSEGEPPAIRVDGVEAPHTLPTTAGVQPHGHRHPHQSAIKSIALSTRNPVSLSTIELFLDRLLVLSGDDLLRVKGLVRTVTDPEKPVLIQGVGQSFGQPERLPGWPDTDTSTRLVIIGNNLDEPSLRYLFASLSGSPVTDMPDRQALEENPLATLGFT